MDLLDAIAGRPQVYYPGAVLLCALAWWAAARIPRRSDRIAVRGVAFGVLLGSIVAGVHSVVVMSPLWVGFFTGVEAVPYSVAYILLWSAFGCAAAGLLEAPALVPRRIGGAMIAIACLGLLLLAASGAAGPILRKPHNDVAERARASHAEWVRGRAAILNQNIAELAGTPAPDGLVVETADGLVIGRTPERDVAYISAPLRHAGRVPVRLAPDAVSPDDYVVVVNLAEQAEVKLGALAGSDPAELAVVPGDVLMVGRRSNAAPP